MKAKWIALGIGAIIGLLSAGLALMSYAGGLQ